MTGSHEARDFANRPGAALVLGGSGAVGAAVAGLLIERGSAVALTYRRDSPRVAGLLARPADPVPRGYRLELTDAAACARTVAAVARDFGGIHSLIYAAGPLVPLKHLSRVDPQQFRDQLESDAVAFFNAVQPALPHLRAARGSIVAVTTAATRRYPVRDGLSAAPKGAVEALVRALAAEEGRFGVRANCVGPGMLEDGMAQRLIASGDLDERALDVARATIPLRRFGTAADVAEAACFLASERARYISGQKLDVDGGFGV
jgi:NAD(P)-dependent dehydrogenase (short-subunit alcohol dehydrogenase family)